MSDQEAPVELFKIIPETRQIWKKRRYHIAVLIFLGCIIIFILRINLSVAIVAMVDRDFHWESNVQGFVLSSFYYGYAAIQLFGGWMARKIGGHIVKRVRILSIRINNIIILIRLLELVLEVQLH